LVKLTYGWDKLKKLTEKLAEGMKVKHGSGNREAAFFVIGKHSPAMMDVLKRSKIETKDCFFTEAIKVSIDEEADFNTINKWRKILLMEVMLVQPNAIVAFDRVSRKAAEGLPTAKIPDPAFSKWDEERKEKANV